MLLEELQKMKIKKKSFHYSLFYKLEFTLINIFQTLYDYQSGLL